MLGALVNGKIADLLGRRGVSPLITSIFQHQFNSHPFRLHSFQFSCKLGYVGHWCIHNSWVACYTFCKGCLLPPLFPNQNPDDLVHMKFYLNWNKCVQNAFWLDLGRLLLGFSVGIVAFVVIYYCGSSLRCSYSTFRIHNSKYFYPRQVPVYIAEITTKDNRGLLTTANQVYMHINVKVQNIFIPLDVDQINTFLYQINV